MNHFLHLIALNPLCTSSWCSSFMPRVNMAWKYGLETASRARWAGTLWSSATRITSQNLLCCRCSLKPCKISTDWSTQWKTCTEWVKKKVSLKHSYITRFNRRGKTQENTVETHGKAFSTHTHRRNTNSTVWMFGLGLCRWVMVENLDPRLTLEDPLIRWGRQTRFGFSITSLQSGAICGTKQQINNNF